MRTHPLTIRTTTPDLVPRLSGLLEQLNAFFAQALRQFNLADVIVGPLPPTQGEYIYSTGAYPIELWLETEQPYRAWMDNHENGGFIIHVKTPTLDLQPPHIIPQTIMHEAEHGFGFVGDIYHIEWMPDPTGIEPHCQVDSYTIPLTGYWSDEVRSDMLHDPIFRFSESPKLSRLSQLICSGDYRFGPPDRFVPIENRLRIHVVDEDGSDIVARVCVWHINKGRDWNEGTAKLLLNEYGDRVDMPFSENDSQMYSDRIRLVKIERDGYVKIAGWVSVYDKQLAALTGEDAVLRVEMRKAPKPQVIPQPRLEITKYNGFATLVARDVVPGVEYELFSEYRIADRFVATTATQELPVVTLNESSPSETFRLRTATPRSQRSAPSMPAIPEWSMRPRCACHL